jgi:hypothetical protein
MWREFISGISSECKFHNPASQAQIDALATSLNVTLPPELVSLLRETDGIYHASNYIDLIWPCEMIRRENLKFRTEKAFIETWKPLDDMVFFSYPGFDSITFGFPVLPQGVAESHVLVWYPIGDNRVQIAPSLKDFVSGWLKGTIAI